MPSFGTITTVIDQSATPVTFAHNNNGNLLVVWLCVHNGQESNAVTYNGVTVPQIGSRDFGGIYSMRMYLLANPAQGSNTVSIDNGTGFSLDAYAASILNGNTADPNGTVVSADGTASPATVDATSATGGLVLDGVIVKGIPTSLAAGAGQTEQWNQAAHGGIVDGASTEAGAPTVTMSWTWSGATDAWGIMAVPLKPASGSLGGGFSTTFFRPRLRAY